MNELTVKTNELELPQIKWNEKEVADAVTELVKKYQGLELDESQLASAKKDLAAIRKVKKNLNDEKIKVKKAWNVNYTEFENDIKTYMHDIDVVINDIDEQVKTYEQALKDERKAEIVALTEYKAIKDFVAFDDSWLLKKWTDEKLIELFTEKLEQIDRDIKTIKLTATSQNLENNLYIEKYKTQPIDLVIERIIEDGQTVATVKEETPQEVKFDDTEQVLTLTRTLVGTKSQLKALKDYADKIGVEIK